MADDTFDYRGDTPTEDAAYNRGWTDGYGAGQRAEPGTWQGYVDRANARSRPADCGDHYIAGYNAALDAVRYEQACAAREEWQRRAIEAEARLAAAGLGSDIDITCGDIEGRWIEDHLATLDKP